MGLNDDQLWDAFAASTLPVDAWTHEVHLRVAWLFLQRFEIDEAHILMRVGIIRLNAHHGLVETPSRGYFETLTYAWLAIVRRVSRASPQRDGSLAFVRAHAHDLGRDAPLRHYSKERLMTLEARARFVPPDREPF